MKTLDIKITTPVDIYEIDDIISLTLSTIDGELTILPEHYPLMSAINATKVKFVKSNKDIVYAFASEGIINVREKELVLLLDAFEFKENIDLERAKASYQRAYERITSHNDNVDIARAQAALNRALIRISIAEGK